MTKSTITREQLKEWVAQFDEDGGCDATDRQLEALIRQSLAAMDSEPVRSPVLAYADSYRDMAKQGVESVPIWSVITDLERNIAPLYRHAQQAPASEPVYQYWCYTTVENSEGDPEEFWFWKDCEKDFYDLWKNAKRTLYKTPQPALVVPPEQHWEELCRQHPDMSIGDAIIRAAWWNHCRAAMLQAKSLASINPAPAMGSLPETGEVLHTNSPANPDCWCRTCRPVDLNDMRFVVCPDCGNKRCPRANDHRNACTGSNEPGQEGSAYPAAPQSPGSEAATVPGKWIPVSEQMPEREVDVQVYCVDKKEQMVAYLERNELEGYFRFATWRTGDGIYCQPTHWMPLPEAPQEDINALIPLVSRNEREVK